MPSISLLVLALIVSFFAPCNASSTSEASSNSIAAKFQKIFGYEQFFAHFESSEKFIVALKGKQEMLKHLAEKREKLSVESKDLEGISDDVLSNYVLCTSHVGGEKMRESLNSQFGEDFVHPVYQSAIGNSFCFLIARPASKTGIDQALATTLAVQAGVSIEFVLPQPDVMKIHHSVLDHLLLTDNYKSKNGGGEDIATSTLSVSLGLGNGRNNRKSSSRFSTAGFPVHEQFRVELMSEHPHEHIKKLLQSTLARGILEDETFSSSDFHLSAAALSTKSGLWGTAFNELTASSVKLKNQASGESSMSAQDIDICGFSKLLFSHGHDEAGLDSSSEIPVGSSFTIRGLGNIATDSSTPSSCFAALLAFLATHEEHISDIRYALPNKILNKYGKSVVQKMTSDQGTPYTAANLTGSGQIVGVGDSGLDERSCFFSNTDQSLVARSTYFAPTFDLTKRKVIQYISYKNDFDTRNGHGTHVCGTIAGKSLTTKASDNGHGEGAKIAFFDMSTDGNSISYPEPIGQNVFKPAFDAGARLHSNSWGSSLNLYQQTEVDIDSYHIEQDQFLALFAAGNDGDDGYYSVGSPGCSKNAMTVGASKSGSSSGTSFTGPMDRVAYFSSLGPTFDKRIKPDVVAPGSYIESAAASGSTAYTCSVLSMQGTSMATPGVAGVAAQIRQYFEDSDFWAATCRNVALYTACTGGAFAPRGATVKAMLIHSGERMTSYAGGSGEPFGDLGNQPDYYQGFGRVFLQNVLPLAGIESVLDLYVEETTMQSWQKLQYNITVTDVTRPVKVTVVWMDPVNSVISDKLLLHDIDVTLKLSSGSSTIFGNNVQNDETNNVEQAMVETPVVGTYVATILSKTFSENSGSQKVSIIITSGGSVTSRDLETVTSSSTSYCSSGQQLVTMNLLDRGADGWPSSTSYEIRDSSDLVFKTGTLGSEASRDFNVPVTFCLPSSEVYTVSLLLPDGNDDAMDVGLEIPQCKVYLSYYQQNATLDLSTDTAQCNPCATDEVSASIYFADSPFLDNYGWNRGSTYSLSKVSGGDFANGTDFLQLKGTLLYGYVGWVEQCLSVGSYRLVIDGEGSNDDDYYSGEFLYTATLVGCDLLGGMDDVLTIFDDDQFYPYPYILQEHQMKITVSEGMCEVDISPADDNSPPSSAANNWPSVVVSLSAALASVLTIMAF